MIVTLEKAKELLLSGKNVAVPTETVYGLAASLVHDEAVSQIFTLKGRPSNNPLIIHLADPIQVNLYAEEVPESFPLLAEAFWPGALTLVLPAVAEHVPEEVRAGLPTAAFRVPRHPLARKLLEGTGPLVMPSANISGRPSATSPQHVEDDFGESIPVLDGGVCKGGLESTVIIFQEGRWKIIREGALAPGAFEKVLGYLPEVEKNKGNKPLCPGQIYRHYSPSCKLILSDKPAGNVVIGFSDREYPEAEEVISLAPATNPEEAAGSLYAVLRDLDKRGIEEAVVDSRFPKEGLWGTIEERLKKAASTL